MLRQNALVIKKNRKNNENFPQNQNCKMEFASGDGST